MEVRILHKFHDGADFTKVYPVGETFTFDDARAENLIKRGLVETVVEEDTTEEDAPEVANEPVEVVEEKPVEEAVETVVEEEETPAIEEKAIKPVATKRRGASKDN